MKTDPAAVPPRCPYCHELLHLIPMGGELPASTAAPTAWRCLACPGKPGPEAA